jgi:hypothetical protein
LVTVIVLPAAVKTLGDGDDRRTADKVGSFTVLDALERRHARLEN